MIVEAYPKNSPPPSSKPFTVQLHQAEKDKAGSFRPEACLVLNQSFRSSGLLQQLPPEDLKSLLLLLTYLSPNGHCEAAIHQLCSAMRLSGLKVRRRMSRLVSFHWHGAQLVVEHKRESGLLTYVPHPALIELETVPAYEPPPPPIKAVPREEVIAYSRRRYNTPRAIAEQQVEAQLRPPSGLARAGDVATRRGWHTNPSSQTDALGASDHENVDLLRKLEQAGLTTEQALQLLRRFTPLRIERQLRWLPYRNAKNPAGLLIAAIEDNYEAPLHFRPRDNAPVTEGQTDKPAVANAKEPASDTSSGGPL